MADTDRDLTVDLLQTFETALFVVRNSPISPKRIDRDTSVGAWHAAQRAKRVEKSPGKTGPGVDERAA